MLSLKTIQGKIALVLVSLVVLWTYNSFHRPTRSLRQQAFERWLTDVEQDLKVQARADKALPELQVLVRTAMLENRVSSPESERRLVLKEIADLPKILRLLELVREANVFSYRRGLDFANSGEQGFEVEVRAPGHSFIGAMNADDLEQSVQAKTFLTLFNVFFQEQQVKDETKSGTGLSTTN